MGNRETNWVEAGEGLGGGRTGIDQALLFCYRFKF